MDTQHGAAKSLVDCNYATDKDADSDLGDDELYGPDTERTERKQRSCVSINRSPKSKQGEDALSTRRRCKDKRGEANSAGESETSVKKISKYINYRIIGYSFAGFVHLANIIAMALALRGPIMEEDPDVKLFYSMEFFYCTIWNLIIQLVYISMGLSCDVPIMLNLRIKNIKILNHLRSYRKIVYSGLLWPLGLNIFAIYWPVYIYDRNLIFPEYIDRVLSQVSNYIMHMFIVFIILWDLVYLPNPKPASIKYSLAHCGVLCAVYYIAIFALYGVRGVWPYPILHKIYGTVYFPVVFIVITILLFLTCFVQWPIRSYIWRKRNGNIR